MGIADLRAQLSDLPGASEMTMCYEDGGRVQVFVIDGIEVRVGPQAGADAILSEYHKAKGA